MFEVAEANRSLNIHLRDRISTEHELLLLEISKLNQSQILHLSDELSFLNTRLNETIHFEVKSIETLISHLETDIHTSNTTINERISNEIEKVKNRILNQTSVTTTMIMSLVEAITESNTTQNMENQFLRNEIQFVSSTLRRIINSSNRTLNTRISSDLMIVQASLQASLDNVSSQALESVQNVETSLKSQINETKSSLEGRISNSEKSLVAQSLLLSSLEVEHEESLKDTRKEFGTLFTSILHVNFSLHSLVLGNRENELVRFQFLHSHFNELNTSTSLAIQIESNDRRHQISQVNKTLSDLISSWSSQLLQDFSILGIQIVATNDSLMKFQDSVSERFSFLESIRQNETEELQVGLNWTNARFDQEIEDLKSVLMTKIEESSANLTSIYIRWFLTLNRTMDSFNETVHQELSETNSKLEILKNNISEVKNILVDMNETQNIQRMVELASLKFHFQTEFFEFNKTQESKHEIIGNDIRGLSTHISSLSRIFKFHVENATKRMNSFKQISNQTNSIILTINETQSSRIDFLENNLEELGDEISQDKKLLEHTISSMNQSHHERMNDEVSQLEKKIEFLTSQIEKVSRFLFSVCNGINGSDPIVCSGRGICALQFSEKGGSRVGRCFCEGGYAGQNCEIVIDFEISSESSSSSSVSSGVLITSTIGSGGLLVCIILLCFFVLVTCLFCFCCYCCCVFFVLSWLMVFCSSFWNVVCCGVVNTAKSLEKGKGVKEERAEENSEVPLGVQPNDDQESVGVQPVQEIEKENLNNFENKELGGQSERDNENEKKNLYFENKECVMQESSCESSIEDEEEDDVIEGTGSTGSDSVGEGS